MKFVETPHQDCDQKDDDNDAQDGARLRPGSFCRCDRSSLSDLCDFLLFLFRLFLASEFHRVSRLQMQALQQVVYLALLAGREVAELHAEAIGRAMMNYFGM